MNPRIIKYTNPKPSVLSLRDWLVTHEDAAATITMLVNDLGLGRGEVAENYPKGIIARACKTRAGFTNLTTALGLAR